MNDPVNLIDPSGKAPPLIVLAAGGGALAGAVGAAIGTWAGGGSFSDGIAAMPEGAIGGALAGTVAGITAVAGTITVTGAVLGVGLDLLYTGINAINAVPGNSPVQDVVKGGKKLSCP